MGKTTRKASDAASDTQDSITKARGAASQRRRPARRAAAEQQVKAVEPRVAPQMAAALAAALASEPFAPGEPIRPTPGLSGGERGPRQWAFPVGYNLAQLPRATEQTSFDQLRSLAALYDGAQLCERAYFDALGRLELRALPRAELLAEDERPTAPRWREATRRIEAFLESPDRTQDLRAWLVAFVRDLLEIDAVAVYARRTRGGDLYALELVDGACYAHDVEVLTDSGWKRFADVDLDRDRFATRNQRTRAFEWQRGVYFHRAEWDSTQHGDLYHFVSRGLDLLVTPNHRMLVNSLPRPLGGSRHRVRGEAIVHAADLAEYRNNALGIPMTSVWEASDIEEMRIPPSTPRAREFVCSGDDFAAFIGMYLAEGCATGGDQVMISQRPESKGFLAFRELFRRLFGRDVCHTGTNFVIGHKTLHDYLQPLGKAHEKFIPSVVMSMSARQLGIFWQYYMLGGGHIDKAGRRSKGGRERITTVSRRMADQLQEVAQKIGFSASVLAREPTRDTVLPTGRVILKEHKRTRYDVGLRRSRTSSFQVQRVPYNGPVYCVSVPNEVIYVRRKGKAAWCGNTIKPLLDGAGRPPLPPTPAYQQFLYGAPAGWYTRDELDYIRETARTDSPYGVSRIERIILRVNQALRKQSFDLARFTDGATPLGVIQPPENLPWTPEQLETFERAFNGLLAGADRMRVRARALPPGATWRALSGDDPLVEFDRFLLNVTVAAFGLTMDELGFTDTSNRSVGQSQENVVYRRAVAPVVTLVAAYLTRQVRRWLDDRFTISFGGFEEPEDFAVRAEAFAKLIPLGVVSAQYVARQLHLPYPARS